LQLASGFFSVTHHPRLGKQREKSDLWKATSCNGRAAQSLNGTKSGRRAFRHQFMGRDGHGNNQLAKDASANSLGLLSRPGVLTPGRLACSCKAHIREQIVMMEGRTPEEVLASAGKDPQFRMQRRIEYCLSKSYMVLLQTPESSGLHTPEKRSSLSTDESIVKRAKTDNAAI